MTQQEEILTRSPYDDNPTPRVVSVPIIPHRLAHQRWKPSRFNVRATTADGRLILWNTFSQSITAFASAKANVILKYLKKEGVIAPREGILAYLVDRGYLIPDNVNEFSRVQYEFGRQQYRNDILQLILLASEDCNFRCTYCYERFERGTMRPEVRSSIKLLVTRQIKYLKDLSISWFGGEPLYGLPAIADLAPFFLDITNRSGVRLVNHMTTNGYLLTKDTADRLLAWHINDFQITIDGAQADHDRNRHTRDGRGSFDTIFRNLVDLSRRTENFNVVIRVNFDQKNKERMSDLLDKVDIAFKNDHRFSLAFHAVGQWGGPNDENLSVCGKDEAISAKHVLIDAARSHGLKVNAGTVTDIQGPGSQVCYAARPYSFIIGATGQLMKCTIALDTKAYNIVGQIKHDGTLELDRDKMAMWTQPAFEQDGVCRSCVMVTSCQGMYCPLIRLETGQRPCPDSRQTAKRQLRKILESRVHG